MKGKGKGKKEKGKIVVETKAEAELRPDQRAILANRIHVQLLSLENDGVVLENMPSIKKLYIMLNLFEKNGIEFDTVLPLPELQDRYLEVRLRTNRNRPSVVVIRHGSIPSPNSAEKTDKDGETEVPLEHAVNEEK